MCNDIYLEEDAQAWMVWPHGTRKTKRNGISYSDPQILLNDPHEDIFSGEVIWIEKCGEPYFDATYKVRLPNGEIKSVEDYSLRYYNDDNVVPGQWGYYKLRGTSQIGMYIVTIETESTIFTHTISVRDYFEYVQPPTIAIVKNDSEVNVVATGEQIVAQFRNFSRFDGDQQVTVIAGLYQNAGLYQSDILVADWVFSTSSALYEQEITIPEDAASGRYTIIAQIQRLQNFDRPDPSIPVIPKVGDPADYYLFVDDFYSEFYVEQELEPLSVESSSEYRDRYGVYPASNAIDGDNATAWTEGVDGSGVGQWIQVNFEQPVTLNRINVNIGYDSNSDLFEKNNRVKRAAFFFSNGYNFEYTFTDQRGLQNAYDASGAWRYDASGALSGGITTDYVKFIILEVYRGNKYNDTAISEMEFWGAQE